MISMPLIPQQDIVVVNAVGVGAQLSSAADELRKRLESYPPCRIISISAVGGRDLVAVIETI
jgi:hypothetical protein